MQHAGQSRSAHGKVSKVGSYPHQTRYLVSITILWYVFVVVTKGAGEVVTNLSILVYPMRLVDDMAKAVGLVTQVRGFHPFVASSTNKIIQYHPTPWPL